MNIVIVEDEALTRDGLVRIISQNTRHNIVGVAEDGEKGAEMIEHLKPNLILTDISTPNKSGLEMLHELKAKQINIPSIILTGYSLFEYAQEAIKIGVSEYLLKPITVEDLTQCLERIEQMINNHNAPLPSTQELVTLFLSCQDAGQKQNYIQQLRITLQANVKSQFVAILIRPRVLDTKTYSEITVKIQQTIEMMCYENCFVLKLPFGYGILILSSNMENNKRFEASIEQNVMKEIQGISLCTVMAARFDRLDQLEHEILEMTKMSVYSLSIAPESIIIRNYIDALKFEPVSYPITLEIKMKQAIYQKNQEQIIRVAEEFKELMFANFFNPEEVVENFMRFLSNAYKATIESKLHLAETYSYQSMAKKIYSAFNKEDFLDAYEEMIDWITEKNQEYYDSKNLIITKVIQYIREHYSQNISLTQMAELVCVTPEYLSKLFNKEMDVTFSAFLKNFRISHAKRLILSSEYKIQEVSEAVGFTDPKYFNRVFKEICGESPSDFKKGNQ